jgi:hypothetical protein
MKQVEVSDEAYEVIMKDNMGANFDAMAWKLIRDHKQATKSASEIMKTVFVGMVAKNKEDAEMLMHRMDAEDKKREMAGT